MRNPIRIILAGCSAIGILMVGVPTISAQETLAPPVNISPAAPASPLTTSPAPIKPPLTPPQLVDKSVRDLARGKPDEAAKDDVTALQRGPLLIHGNYCGVGNRPGTEPTDPLDAACMRHDACTPTGKMPSCACNKRLGREATGIAEDPTTPPDLKVLASAMAASMAVLICQ